MSVLHSPSKPMALQAKRSPRQRTQLVLALMAVAAVASILLACSNGSIVLSAPMLLQAMAKLLGVDGGVASGLDSALAATLLTLRLDRALVGFVTGAMLSLAGVMMQALLRNPLADPYVLGVSGGAAVGALAAMLFFSAAWAIDLAAFGGALAVALLLLLLANRDLRGGVVDGNAPFLLLTGVIVASGCGALIALMLSIAPDNRLRGMVFWLIGDLSGAPLRLLPWVMLIAATVYALRMARNINLIAQHAEAATTLGVQVGALKRGLFVCSALLTASAVASAGSIGFVGLIVPHACRFAFGPDHRLLLPAATLVGGTFMVLADTLARSVVAPLQLPVGVITAMIGVPIFLLQLHHVRRR